MKPLGSPGWLKAARIERLIEEAGRPTTLRQRMVTALGNA